MSKLVATVKARKCGCCGHHEIVALKENGDIVPLNPGMKIILYDMGETHVEVDATPEGDPALVDPGTTSIEVKK